MPVDVNAISKTLEDIKNRALTVQSNVNDLKNQSVSNTSSSSDTGADMGRTLTGLVNQLGSTISDQQVENRTIMQKFANRRTLAEQAAENQKKLIQSQAETSLGTAQDLNQQEMTNASEARRGFATNLVYVQNLQKTGEQRISDIEKARDELLLKADTAKADEMDKLIVDEQNMITQARQSLISNLGTLASLTISAGNFETPAQKSARELAATSHTAIMNLQAKAPDAGITPTDTYEQALEKYRNSQVYKNDIRKGEADIALVEAQAQKANADAQKALTDAKNAGSTIDNASLATSPLGLDKASAFVAGMRNALQGLPENQRTESYNILNSYLKSGDEAQAKEYLIRTAFGRTSGTEQAGAVQRNQAIDSLKTIKDLLNEYVTKSGDTGLVSGTIQDIKNKLGRSGDPELVKIGTRITQALQIYRNSITGAAWGDQETAEYKQLFPSYKNENKLNTAIIDGMLQALDANQRIFLGSYIGQNTYDTIFGGDNTQAITQNTNTASSRNLTQPQIGVDVLQNNMFVDLFKNLQSQ